MDAFDKLNSLEERVDRAVRTIESLRREKTALESELTDARLRIRRLETEVRSMSDQQGRVRHRVQTLISRIAELDEEHGGHVV